MNLCNNFLRVRIIMLSASDSLMINSTVSLRALFGTCSWRETKRIQTNDRSIARATDLPNELPYQQNTCSHATFPRETKVTVESM